MATAKNLGIHDWDWAAWGGVFHKFSDPALRVVLESGLAGVGRIAQEP